jgi:hypothetical protein
MKANFTGSITTPILTIHGTNAVGIVATEILISASTGILVLVMMSTSRATKPEVKQYKTKLTYSPSSVLVDAVQFLNKSNQHIRTECANKSTLLEGGIACEGNVSALNSDNVDVNG